MRIALNTVLDQVAVEVPCPVSWDAMHGDEQVRFCERCQQNVYNLSEMTTTQAVRLIEAKQDRLCIQTVRSRDGILLTADSPVGWRWAFFKRLRRRMAWAASLFAILFLSGCPMAGGNMAPRQLAPVKDPAIDKAPEDKVTPSSPK
jgi:hypothetical protein